MRLERPGGLWTASRGVPTSSERRDDMDTACEALGGGAGEASGAAFSLISMPRPKPNFNDALSQARASDQVSSRFSIDPMQANTFHQPIWICSVKMSLEASCSIHDQKDTYQ
ncbi:hypothetical protein GQ600_18375 [Phytophthora cactorum]|nr:hypothetical protein GQ600_18375 [Phytophthora cactorum]